MRTDDFDFVLPQDAIALRPIHPRDHAKLLEVRAAEQNFALSHHRVFDLPHLLRKGDCLVLNNTKVLPARLIGLRQRAHTSAKIELLLHRRLEGADASESLWRAFARPHKKLQVGDELVFHAPLDMPSLGPHAPLPLTARVAMLHAEGEVDVVFSRSGDAFNAALAEFGVVPLPPYIAGKRAVDAADATDYQTVYARHMGSVAAPTAGLHFTPQLMEALTARGIEMAELTLHVGAGTFLPVKADNTQDHVIHAEWGEISTALAGCLNTVRQRGGRIIAVGTTSLRTLEAACDSEGMFHPLSSEIDLFITPGYRFGGVDGLITNFHLPRSTLFMLVCAFCGLDTMKAAYAEALAHAYRFYSYGDAALLWPKPSVLAKNAHNRMPVT